MTINELIKGLNIKNPTSKIKNHPKMFQLLDFCNSHDIYRSHIYIGEEGFLTLLENINSLETLLIILRNPGVLMDIDYYPEELACFYNIYNPEILQYGPEARILIDEEYLKYATKEWTENVLKNQTKVLEVSNNKLTLKENYYDEDDENSLESYLLNLVALKKCKELNLLKEAIEKLSQD